MTTADTWQVHVRIEKNGTSGEYNDRITAPRVRGFAVGEKVIVESVIDMIVNAHPALKGGQLTICRARKD
jgi:hypothetical protein